MTTPILCDVQSITPLTESVHKIVLKPQTALEFKAGQYLLVHVSDDDKRPFSIASPTDNQGHIELHIGAEPSNAYAYEVLQLIQNNPQVTVSGGFGEAYYRETSRASILVAGGTGFSYAYSILLEALHRDADADITLYWGARKYADFYLLDELKQLADNHRHFTFIPVIEFAADDWKGRTGWVHQAVLADYPSLQNSQVYIAGRFEMAKTARDDFQQHGLPADALYGDAYAFI